jgi:putative transcriptional regulator
MVSLEDIQNMIQHWIRHPNPWVVGLIMALISSGILIDLILQPNVVYEELPVYKINTSEAADIKSVVAVSLKNTGYSEAHGVKLVTYSNISDATKFYQDKNEIVPDHFKELIDVEAKPDLYRMVYSIDAFAAGANIFICISAPYKEPEVKISGTYEYGKDIKIEKSFLKGPIVIIGLFTLGFLTCFFIISIIRRIREGAPPFNLNKLRVFREMHDLTQEDLAVIVGVTRQTINAIENRRYNPSLEVAFKLAKHFEVKIEDIFISNR